MTRPYKLYVFNEINARQTILKIDIPTRDSAPDGATWVYSMAIAFTDAEMLGADTVSPRGLGMRIRQQTKQIPRSLISEELEAQLVTDAIALLQKEAKFWRNVDHTKPQKAPTISASPTPDAPASA
jgi:hypothetical protein